MDKPKPEHQVKPSLDYIKCRDYIKNKYKTSDYVETKLWHRIVDSRNISSGCHFWLDLYPFENHENKEFYPEEEYLEYWREEFGEYASGDQLYMYVRW